jgi:hypothetical protein
MQLMATFTATNFSPQIIFNTIFLSYLAVGVGGHGHLATLMLERVVSRSDILHFARQI